MRNLEYIRKILENPTDTHIIICFLIAGLFILLLAFTYTQLFTDFIYYFPDNVKNYIGWYIKRARKIANTVITQIKDWIGK